MTALEKLERMSRTSWFVALFRWSMIGLVPATTTFCGWLVWTVYTSQLTLAGLDNKVEAVTRRVDNIDAKLVDADRDRSNGRDKVAEQTAQVASRLSSLEASQALIIKQMDRLLDILDHERQSGKK